MTPHEFIELDGEEEGEGEEVMPRTDEEIVEEITRVKGWLDGEIVDEGEAEDDGSLLKQTTYSL